MQSVAKQVLFQHFSKNFAFNILVGRHEGERILTCLNFSYRQVCEKHIPYMAHI